MRLYPQANTQLPPNRSFGFLFAAIFAGLSLYGVYRGWPAFTTLAWAVAAIVLVVVAMLFPVLLSPFNRAWFLLGVLLGRIVSPIVLGLIFFGMITPVAFVSRLFGRDELRLKPRDVQSYWIERKPPGPAPASFKNQF